MPWSSTSRPTVAVTSPSGYAPTAQPSCPDNGVTTIRHCPSPSTASTVKGDLAAPARSPGAGRAGADSGTSVGLNRTRVPFASMTAR